MRIKRINLAEYQIVTGLFDQYRVFYKQAPDVELANQFIRERLENNESIIFVAFADDFGTEKAVGFTQLYPLISSMRAKNNWLLNDLYVEAGYRNQGIGEALIKTAMEFAKSENAEFVKLETAFDNFSAQRLYEAIGFKKQELTNDFFVYRIEI
jgi:ribosomal protein S18 acetylase RimI-like enzyme